MSAAPTDARKHAADLVDEVLRYPYTRNWLWLARVLLAIITIIGIAVALSERRFPLWASILMLPLFLILWCGLEGYFRHWRSNNLEIYDNGIAVVGTIVGKHQGHYGHHYSRNTFDILVELDGREFQSQVLVPDWVYFRHALGNRIPLRVLENSPTLCIVDAEKLIGGSQSTS